MHQHIRRLDADADHTGQQTDHGMRSVLGRLLKPLKACHFDRLDLVHDEAQPRMSRRSSAKVFGGSAMPSGVRNAARRSAALRNVDLKPRMPKRTRQLLIRLIMRVRSPTRASFTHRALIEGQTQSAFGPGSPFGSRQLRLAPS
jgi:hypothetical protein